MKPKDQLNAPEALVLTMVLVSVADGAISDREIGVMTAQVQSLPAFRDFTRDQMTAVTDAAVALLNEDDGLAHAGRLIRAALPHKLRETAYALACEVVAGDAPNRTPAGARNRSLDMLDYVRGELDLDPLVAAAIERGVRARHHPAEP